MKRSGSAAVIFLVVVAFLGLGKSALHIVVCRVSHTAFVLKDRAIL